MQISRLHLAITALACTAASACGHTDELRIFDGSPPSAVHAAARPACSEDLATTEQNWQAFRKKFPYHEQAVVLSDTFGDGCRTLIVSEPPPHVTLAGLEGVAPDVLSKHVVKRNRIGYDGWTADIALTLPPMSDAALSDLVGYLHLYLFQSTYKAHAIKLSDPLPARPDRLTLNVLPKPTEIKDWVLDKDEPLLPVEGGPEASFQGVLASGSPGVYFTKSPGLVAWSIPKGQPINGFAQEARRFVIDSDLIVGAVANAKTVLILGRERVASLELLPPMRFETLALLASAKTDELAQSYERNHLFANRYEEDKDWAPIYLSNELVDTEYGSLLNITDQLLKSWSQRGEVKYGNFRYPAPPSYPFPKPITEMVGSDKEDFSLTFNWNTTGLSGVLQIGGYEILTPQRTGALMVSYSVDDEPDEGLDRFGDIAGQSFAESNDPNLARAVQYTTMYQIFRAFHVTGDPPSAPVGSAAVESVLTDAAYNTLNLMLTADPTFIKDRVIKQVKFLMEHYPIAKDTPPLAIALSIASEIGEVRSFLKLIPPDERKEVLRELARAMAAPRAVFKSINESTVHGSEDEADIGKMLLILASELGKNRLAFQCLVDLREVMQSVVTAASKRPASWIRTPSVVTSSNMSGAVGGHNIDAAVTSVRVSDKVPPGKPQTASDGTIVVNKSDLGRVSLHRGGVALGPKAPIRKPSVALRVQETPSPNGVRGAVVPALGEGHSRAAPPIKYVDVTPEAPRPEIGNIRVERVGTSYIIKRAGSQRDIVVTSRPEVAEQILRVAMRRGSVSMEPLIIEFGELTEEEAWGVMRSMEVHSKRDDVLGLITHGKTSGKDLLKAKCDFSAAEVVMTERTVFKNGESAIGIAIKVPLEAPGKPSLLAKFKIFFRKIVPEKLKEAVHLTAKKILTKLTNKPLTTMDLARAMRRELKRELASEGGDIMIRLTGQGDDITITRRDMETQDHGGTSG